MAHYILRFIITMKHVIYGAILSAAWGLGECCKLPQWGLGWSPIRNRIWCILAWKSDIWWHQFIIFPDFYENIFSPDHSNSPTFSSFPSWPVGTLATSDLPGRGGQRTWSPCKGLGCHTWRRCWSRFSWSHQHDWRTTTWSPPGHAQPSIHNVTYNINLLSLSVDFCIRIF